MPLSRASAWVRMAFVSSTSAIRGGVLAFGASAVSERDLAATCIGVGTASFSFTVSGRRFDPSAFHCDDDGVEAKFPFAVVGWARLRRGSGLPSVTRIVLSPTGVVVGADSDVEASRSVMAASSFVGRVGNVRSPGRPGATSVCSASKPSLESPACMFCA